MKTYLNEQLGFAIDIPEQWSFKPANQRSHIPGKEPSLIFHCRSCEAFNMQVKRLTQESDLSQTEDGIKSYTQEMGYTSLGLGRFTAEGKEQVSARYYMGYGHWAKKYILVLNNVEYAFTAACLEQKLLLEMERDWDQVVSSFRLLKFADKTSQPEYKSTGQMGGVAPERGKITPHVVAQRKLAGMKTYLNEKHGFEIDIPEVWAPAPELPPGLMDALTGPIPPGLNKDCFQYGCYDEAINFEIAPLYPEPLLDDTVIEFKIYAQVQGFTDLHFDRINVAGKEHVCAHYFINDNMGPRWNKKYMLVFGGIEYALTMTCNDPKWFAKREKNWDAIVQSFHLLIPVDESAATTAKAERDRQQRREMVQERIEMLENPGKIYARACQAMALGQYLDARALLEEYLRNKPDHIQAHKDLAAILQKMGDTTGAFQQLKEVERLTSSDSANRSNPVKLVAESGGGGNLFKKTVPVANTGGSLQSPENSLHSSSNVHGLEEKSRQAYTLDFSIRSYLFIAILSYLYIKSRGLSFTALLSLTSESHQPLSASEFNMLWLILFVGIGASICLISLLGVVLNRQSSDNASTFFGFIERTMQVNDKEQRTVGDLLFSDYTRMPNGVLNTIRLQVMNIIHALFKILMIFFSLGLLHPVISLIIALLVFGPKLILHRPETILWQAGTSLLWFYLCYRAMLFWLAKKKGIAVEAGMTNGYQVIANPSLDASIQSAMTKGVTPDFITKILGQESVINAIKNDLLKTDQVGYKETWRLGLITADQDVVVGHLNQISLKRTAVLFSPSYFNFQFNNIQIANGKIIQKWRRFSSYRLRTVLNKGEYIRIRNIQIDTSRPYAENRSQSLTKFLREDGFPLKEFYSDGDPLSSDRGGVIVIDKGKIMITHPKYFVQRKLIDDDGNLVDLGIDEDFSLFGVFGVKIQPAVLNSLVQHASSNGYIPVLRYHSRPCTSDSMLPILDTPVSTGGWADLFVDTQGRAKLFITKEKTADEWVKMMEGLRQLFFNELVKNNYHLLGLVKDKAHLSQYLSKKMEILKEYYIIQDWKLF